jgi:hypothetical protein
MLTYMASVRKALSLHTHEMVGNHDQHSPSANTVGSVDAFFELKAHLIDQPNLNAKQCERLRAD